MNDLNSLLICLRIYSLISFVPFISLFLYMYIRFLLYGLATMTLILYSVYVVFVNKTITHLPAWMLSS